MTLEQWIWNSWSATTATTSDKESRDHHH